MRRKVRYYCYFDERNDDFAGNNIKTKQLPADYEYLPESRAFRFFRPIVYRFVRFICVICEKLGVAMRGKNKKVLKDRDPAKGCFVYGNHTSAFSDAVTGAVAFFRKQCYVISNPDALSIKGIRTLVRFVGALPTPSSRKQFAEFNRAIDTLYSRGCPVVIYPEAHIWPKYSAIRDFSDISFAYPVRLNAPCFAKTTVYKRKRGGRTKGVVYYDGPFYPDPALGEREARAELCARVKACMLSRVKEHGSEPDARCRYKKVGSPDEVRIEIVRE
ncbi:MAG: hypothetical protein J5756_03125 [Clostridia bacterium]|nr:hypothetical protein [Clostridia bacterium]